jgi:enamine deaminase RidA (YjgF/YER057c/UK114 family)
MWSRRSTRDAGRAAERKFAEQALPTTRKEQQQTVGTSGGSPLEVFNPPYPVCTALAVRGLVHPDWILEIECMAYIEPA